MNSTPEKYTKSTALSKNGELEGQRMGWGE